MESDNESKEGQDKDPVEAMLGGDKSNDLADMLSNDEDDESRLEDFEDDELAELDKALDEILDETKNL